MALDMILNRDEMAEQNVMVRSNFNEISKQTEELITLRKEEKQQHKHACFQVGISRKSSSYGRKVRNISKD